MLPNCRRGLWAWILWAGLGTEFALAQTPTAATPPTPAEVEFFEKKIRPVLVDQCSECHAAQAKKIQGGLRVDTRAGLLKGGESGPAIVPRDLAASHLIQAIRYGNDAAQMPPKGKLPAEVIADFERWVSSGAADPRTDQAPAANPAAKQHWAFQRPRAAPVPQVKNAAWPRTDVDRFVLARLEAKGLAPSEDADRRTLLRRLSYDLTGLPPTFAEVEAFAADAGPEAVNKVVDRLLASPHFGERWARHWLDVARYADTKGYVFQEDRNYPEAFTYRDWVIKAFNDDLPYDRFLLTQLAADQLPTAADASSLAAMGFLTLGRRFINNQQDIIDDRIDVVARGLMGLTVTCARCHDHKYDPIPMADYYSLYGVFASCEEPKNAPSPLRMVDSAKPHNARILKRGNPGNPGDEVPRQFLFVVAGEKRQPFQRGSGRLEMAQAIASPDNPLTARVFVNRVWGHLFGTGFVRTPSDFGGRSDPPSQPELLDYLAVRFVEQGWSVKKLLREIVLSRVYQQQSGERPACREADAENQLLWKMNRRRLDLESLRDTVLAVSGTLDRKIGGPSVQLTAVPFTTRRTLYGFIDRQNLPGLFRTFDFASPDTHAPRRFQTTVPQQALFLMNSPFLMEQAEALVRRPTVAAATEPARRIEELYRLVLARGPTAAESALGQEFIAADAAGATGSAVSAAGWQYGYGEFDEAGQRVKRFQRLPHWTGSAWQGGAALPDPQLGWVFLSAEGGHPGNDAAHAAIRRWVAPGDGLVSVQGRLSHPNSQGDGVRGRLVSSRSGLAGQWLAHHTDLDTHVARVEVRAGDTLDLLTDCLTNPSYDGFTWTVGLRFAPAAAGPTSNWNSRDDFRGPAASSLDGWARYAQVLLLANELAFVD